MQEHVFAPLDPGGAASTDLQGTHRASPVLCLWLKGEDQFISAGEGKNITLISLGLNEMPILAWFYLSFFNLSNLNVGKIFHSGMYLDEISE